MSDLASSSSSAASASRTANATQRGMPRDYWRRALRGVLGAWFVVLGNTLEWFEFALYGYLSTEMQTNFFDGNVLGVWAGAVVFGWIGDRFGRRKALLISLTGMMVCTVGQGCVPSQYCCGDAWGTLGLVLLLVLRFSQGLCTGGEIAGVSTYLAEHSDKTILGMMSSTVGFGGSCGFLSACGFALFLHLILSESQMLLWGWRIPFLFSIFPGTLSLLGRRHITETAEFTEMMEEEKKKHGLIQGMESGTTEIEMELLEEPKRLSKTVESISDYSAAPAADFPCNNMHQSGVTDNGIDLLTPRNNNFDPQSAGIGQCGVGQSADANAYPSASASRVGRSRFPVRTLLTDYPYHTVIAFFGISSFSAVWYVCQVYSLSYLQQVSNVSPDQALAMGVIGNFVSISLSPLSGYLCDRYGVGRMFMFGQIAVLLIMVPGWIWIVLAPSVASGFIVLSLWGSVAGLFIATPYLWSAELFPTHIRSTGFLAYNLAVSVFGGCGPLICASMVQHWTKFGPLLYQGFVGIVATTVVVTAYWMHQRNRITLAHLRKVPY